MSARISSASRSSNASGASSALLLWQSPFGQTLPISLTEVSFSGIWWQHPPKMRTKTSAFTTRDTIFVLAFIPAFVFLLLWVSERDKPPVTVVKEVPKEVIREVDSRLTPEQAYAISFTKSYLNAKSVTGDDVFFSIPSLKVAFDADDAVTKVAPKSELQDKFELTLRRYGVPIDETSRYLLLVGFEGIWEQDISLTFVEHVKLMDTTVIVRQDQHRLCVATLWESSYFGFAGKQVAKKAFLDKSETLAERVANAYLKANPKTRASAE
jgi:hypothetical protein